LIRADEPNPLVSVIIVTYNSRKFIDKCLDSVLGSGYQSIEVVVVDNNSLDGTAEHIETKYPGVVLVRNASNVRFAIGNNVGIRKSHGSLFFLLNPDAWIEGDCVKELVRTAMANPKLGIIGCKVYYPNGLVQSAGGTIMASGHTNLIGHEHRDSRKYSVPGDTEWVLGAAMLVTRDVLERVGLLDPIYYLYFEEVDLCWRAHNAGFGVWYAPTAVAYHYGGQSLTYRGQFDDQKRSRIDSVSRVLLVSMNYPLPYLAYWALSEARRFLLLLASHSVHPRKETGLGIVNLCRAYVFPLKHIDAITKGRIARRNNYSWIPARLANRKFSPRRSGRPPFPY
jgi:GT2 family glycosyltransferase